MKNKIIIPIISIALIILTVVCGVVSVTLAKNKEIRLDESDVSMKDIIVDGNKMKVTITSSNSLGMKITGNTYTFENGTLKFKLYGKRDVKLGEPLKENQVITLVIEAPGDIEEIYFQYLNDKKEETDSLKSFSRGTI